MRRLKRDSKPRAEQLETRALLSLPTIGIPIESASHHAPGLPVVAPLDLPGIGPIGSSRPGNFLRETGPRSLKNLALGDTVKELEKWYGIPRNGGAGTVIAIVDAYNDTSISQQMAVFDRREHLAPATVNQINLGPPGNTANETGWDAEETLDTEVIHALAPLAQIDLVEAASNAGQDVYNAQVYALTLPGVVAVNDSWGTYEVPDEGNYDYSSPRSVIVAATGDSGPNVVSYPASLADVLDVGGTTLFPLGRRTKETVWGLSGGGTSAYILKPAFQGGLPYGNRSVPDTAADANPYSGFVIYFDGSWIPYGGTSLSACIVTSLVSIGQSERIAVGQQPIGTSQLLQGIYDDQIALRGQGQYNQQTGLGSPIGSRFLSLF
jgi:hypothetical protein